MKKNTVAISQFDGTSKILKIEITTGKGAVVSASEIPEEKISFGLFDIYGDNEEVDFVSLLATPDGPMLFFKEIQYRPEFGKTKIDLKDEGGISHFLVSHEGVPVFGLFYNDKFGIGLHPYNRERADVDFYYWLFEKVRNPNFYKVYSKNFILIE